MVTKTVEGSFPHSVVWLCTCHECTQTQGPDKVCVSVQLKCSFYFCSSKYVDVKGLVSHLSGHIQESVTVSCPFDGCSKTFNVKSSFSSHISRCHRGWNVTQIATVHLCVEAEEQSF